jgi:hypothetical protein
MEEYAIAVETGKGLVDLLVKPVFKGPHIEYEVWDKGGRLFSLVCCSDGTGDTLALTDEYAKSPLDASLVEAVKEVIQSEEE